MRLTLLKDQVTETYFMSAVIFVQNWKYIIIIIIVTHCDNYLLVNGPHTSGSFTQS